MRLWHYKLIPYLPDSQLLAQWRELNSIFKNQPKHILINYVYEYPKDDLYWYTNEILNEMRDRGFKYNLRASFDDYFKGFKVFFDENGKSISIENPFPDHHNDRYLMQCFHNLQEKFDRGQKDFTDETYLDLANFIISYFNEAGELI